MTTSTFSQAYTAYEGWDVTAPQIPARSSLFSLEPIGVGTTYVESMTGYIARIAQEHRLRPGSLLNKVVSKQLDKDYGTFEGAIEERFATTVNGTGATAAAIVNALENLTLRHDLRYMTMANWSNVLSSSKLLQLLRAWCPSCYEEWAKSYRTVYEPLIWSFQVVTICAPHQRRLISRCPHCNREQPPLSTNSRPGYCSRCRGWLGVYQSANNPAQAIDESLSEDELAWQTWVINTLGEMLTLAPRLRLSPSKENFIKNLTSCIDQAAWGRINAFSSIIDIRSGNIRRLVKGHSFPTLEMLLLICSRLKISLTEIVSNTNVINLPGGEGVLEQLRLHRMKSACEPVKKIDWADMESELKEAVKEYPPPSIGEIERRTGHYGSRIKRNLPELHAQVIARYNEYNREPVDDIKAEAVLQAALTEVPPPSLQSVIRKLGCRSSGYYYYYHFPDLCFAIAKRFKNYRDKPFDFDEVHTNLQAALAEQPPPAYKQVCMRLNFKRHALRKKFPELTRAIASRHMNYRKACGVENKKMFFQEVRKAVRSIHADGLYASEARVKASLSCFRSKKLLKKAIDVANQELGLVGNVALNKANRR
jgi:TniQ